MGNQSLVMRGGDASGPDGHRAYAVGDIHGRLDLLDRILEKIETDDASRPAARTTIVFLGDLIDRGPQSAQVVERLRTYRPDFAEPDGQSRGGLAPHPGWRDRIPA